MQNVMGIITFNDCRDELKELTKSRPLAAIPFAARYRVIDFILSSMVNSGIKNVGVLVQDKYRALMDHLRSGKEWDLARKQDGLFILPPAAHEGSGRFYKGNIENFYSNLDYLESSRQSHVLIAGSQVICNLDCRKPFRFHQEMEADVTVMYREQYGEPAGKHTVLDCQDDGRIRDMAVNPYNSFSSKVSMEMYLLKKDLLIDLIKECKSRGEYDFVKGALIRNQQNLKLYGYSYKGYVARVDSIQNYYRHNMELLKLEKWEELFFKSGLVHTKIKDDAPVKYQEDAKVTNSMIANGCIIDGRVENSVIFRGVRIKKGAYIKDSIIMQNCEIGSKAAIENVICDKNVKINEGKSLRGEKNYPLVIEKGTTI